MTYIKRDQDTLKQEMVPDIGKSEPSPVLRESTGSIPAWVQDEIKATWRAAGDSGNQRDAFRIIERMTDRLGYGRLNNPSLAE